MQNLPPFAVPDQTQKLEPQRLLRRAVKFAKKIQWRPIQRRLIELMHWEFALTHLLVEASMPLLLRFCFFRTTLGSRSRVAARGEFMPILRPRLVSFYGWMVLVTAARSPLTLAQASDTTKGADSLFAAHCASCHAPYNATRAPWPDTLRLMTQSAILTALESGKMKAVGDGMSHDQRVAVANLLGQPDVAQKSPMNSCPANSAPMANLPLWKWVGSGSLQ